MLLQKPIEIVNSQVETRHRTARGDPSAELIRFTVKAQLARRPPVAAAGGARAAGAR